MVLDWSVGEYDLKAGSLLAVENKKQKSQLTMDLSTQCNRFVMSPTEFWGRIDVRGLYA